MLKAQRSNWSASILPVSSVDSRLDLPDMKKLYLKKENVQITSSSFFFFYKKNVQITISTFFPHPLFHVPQRIKFEKAQPGDWRQRESLKLPGPQKKTWTLPVISHTSNTIDKHPLIYTSNTEDYNQHMAQTTRTLLLTRPLILFAIFSIPLSHKDQS